MPSPTHVFVVYGESLRKHFRGCAGAYKSERTARGGVRYGGLPRVVVGHSMGGLVAMAYADLYTDLTAKLVLMAPAGAMTSRRLPPCFSCMQVRKTPSWPRSLANFSLLYSHRNAGANLHLLGQPNTFLAAAMVPVLLLLRALPQVRHVQGKAPCPVLLLLSALPQVRLMFKGHPEGWTPPHLTDGKHLEVGRERRRRFHAPCVVRVGKSEILWSA